MNGSYGTFLCWLVTEVISDRYDPKTDQWTNISPICSPRDAVGLCPLGDKLFAVGGYDGQQYLNDVECYDPITNEWFKVCVKLAQVNVLVW